MKEESPLKQGGRGWVAIVELFFDLDNLCLLSFFHRAQASRADVDPAHLTVDHNPLALHVGPELTLRPLLGARDVVSKASALTADFTFRHGFTSNNLVASSGTDRYVEAVLFVSYSR